MFGAKVFFLKMKNVFRFITKTSKDGFLENVVISNKSLSLKAQHSQEKFYNHF